MILVAGEALVDLVIDVEGTVAAALGGAPYNTARACGRLGADVAFFGAVSGDRFGSMLAAQLESDGVGVRHLVRVDVPTTLALAELDPGGAATYRFYVDGTSAPSLSAAPRDLTCDVLFAGGLGLLLEPMAETVESVVAAVAPASSVMVDVNCRPLMVTDRAAYAARIDRVVALAHVVKISEEDVAFLMPGADAHGAAKEILRRGPDAVLLTAGSGAVHVFTNEGEVEVAVEPVDVIDTIGAGDSFSGGFLAWWIAAKRTGADLGSLDALVPAVRAASTVAGIVCQRRGADPPWRSELPADWAP